MQIHVFATGRHPKDILRSIAHELVHHSQNERGELDSDGYMGKGYAQKNPKLRKAEMEANDPMLFRDWEDSLKEKENTIYNERRNRKMSLKEWKNKEIGDLLTNRWGFKMDLSKLTEAKHTNEQEEEKEKEEEEEEKPENGKEDKEEKPKNDIEENLDNLKGGLKDYMKNKKGKSDKKSDDKEDEDEDSKESEEEKGGSKKSDKKPDFADLDGDGDNDEPMSQAAKQAKNESINKDKIINEVYRIFMKELKGR